MTGAAGHGVARARGRLAGLKLGLCCCLVAVCAALASPAPVPAPLDLTGSKLVFSEDFTALQVSASGPDTKWTAHTPWHGDFSDAKFVDPRPGFPFGRSGGVFHIELRRMADGHWQSGLLATNDPSGHGFGQVYGYFEMRARMPAGPGLWPAFWLDSLPPRGSTDPSIEIDVIEQYGQFPAAYNSTLTVWLKGAGRKPRSQMKINRVPEGSLSRAFHTYGVKVSAAWTIFYLDRLETWRVPTPPEHHHPLGILLDLGLGGGWPIDKAPSPAFMDVDYVRAYSFSHG